MKNESIDISTKVKEYLETGETQKEICSNLNISEYKLRNIVKTLKENQLLDKEKIIQSKKKLKNKEKYEKNKEKPKLSNSENEARKEAIDIICRKYLDYENSKNFVSALSMKLAQIHLSYSYNIILSTIKNCESSLQYVNQKKFSNEFQKISYICAIIKNNINGVWTKWKKQHLIKIGLDKRYSQSDEETVRRLNNPIKTTPTKRRDFSEFLDD